jgi:RNA polymerase sigma factor (sigma-70 family)
MKSHAGRLTFEKESHKQQKAMQINEFKDKVMPLSNKLLRFAGYFLNDREDAEDVVQDVLLKLWEKRDTLGIVGNLEAFSMQMTRNKCLDKIKSNRVIPMNTEIEKMLSGNSVENHDATEWNDTSALVMDIAGKLPEQQKTAIILRDVEQKEFTEIAEITGMNVNALRVNLSRARKQVRDELLKIWEYENKRSTNIAAKIF